MSVRIRSTLSIQDVNLPFLLVPQRIVYCCKDRHVDHSKNAALQKASVLQSQALKSYEMKISEHVYKRTWPWTVSHVPYTHLLPTPWGTQMSSPWGTSLSSSCILRGFCCIFSVPGSSPTLMENDLGLLTTLTQSTALAGSWYSRLWCCPRQAEWDFNKALKLFKNHKEYTLSAHFHSNQQQRNKRISSH